MARHLLIFLVGLIGLRTLFFEPVFQHLPPEKLGIKEVGGMCWRSDGTMWMATDKGLLHYNGYSTQTFRHLENDSNSLLSNSMRGVLTDAKERLWIFYSDIGGFTIFNPDENTWKHYRPDSTRSDAIPDVVLTGFRQDSKGRFWITTWGNGLVRFFPEKGTFKTYPVRTQETTDTLNRHICPAARIKSMVELPDGRFLLGFFANNDKIRSMPCYFDPEKETFDPYPFDEALNKCSPGLKNILIVSLRIVHFIHIDDQQNIWFGTYSGLIHYDTHKKVFKRVSVKEETDATQNLENTRAFVTDEKGLLWVNTVNNGVMIVDPNTFEATYSMFNPKVPGSISDNFTGSMKKDPDGNIWIITGTGGFSIYSPLSQQFNLLNWESMSLEITDASVNNLIANEMLVKSHTELHASSKSGISYFNPVTRTITGKFDPVASGIRVQTKDEVKYNEVIHRVEDFKEWEDTLVFTSNESPEVYYAQTKKFVRLEERKGFMLHFRHEPRIKKAIFSSERWPQLANILYEADFTSGKLVPFITLPEGSMLSRRYSFLLPNGNWLMSGGAKEFFVIDPRTKKYTVYGAAYKEHFFPDTTINTCHLDAAGTTWFCTQHGLYRFDLTTGKYENVNAGIGIGDEEVMAMTTDKKGVRWIALTNDMIRWDEAQGKVFRFTREAGMMSMKFIPSFAQVDEEGFIYMAANTGVFYFNPANIRIPQNKPVLHVYSVIAGNDTLSAEKREAFTGGNYDIVYHDNSVAIEFYSNQVYTPVPNHFYYRVSGRDSSWQDNGTSNRIHFNNLSPGNYELRVKIRNAYGVESEPLLLTFTIKKPFWQTAWFIGLCLLFAGVLVYFYIKRREHTLRLQKQVLEQKVAERTSEVVEKAKEILQQKDIIEEKNKQLTDSIHYAQRIQQSILPDEKTMRRDFPHHFVLFLPKDIVSGDFYWHSRQGDSILWTLVDCTGHGVPGGFMSMLGAGLLNQIVNEEQKLQPDIVLNELRDRVILALRQTGADGENRDGMDVSFCRYIVSENKLQFAGAFNNLYLIRNGELQEIKGDKQPIGIYLDARRPFTLQEVSIQKGDLLYMSSDGFSDQFGGPKGKKFKSANFEKLLMNVHTLPIEEQLAVIRKTHSDWKGVFEQVDDICVIGVQI